MNNKSKIKLNVALVFILVVIVLLIAWTTGPFYYHFAEIRLVTLYSFLQLFTAAYISFIACNALETRDSLKWQKNPSARSFFICAIGFLYLGFDDLFSLHENMDKLIHLVLRIKETPWTDHVDDFILLTYGFIAVFFIKDIVKEFKKHPYVLPLIICGFILFFVMCCMDFLTNNVETFKYFFSNTPMAASYEDLMHNRDVARMIEESFELLGESFFLAAFLAAFVNIKTKEKPRS